jgi:hypothetical protein
MGVFVEASSFEDNPRFSNLLAGFDAYADKTAAGCNLTVPGHWWSNNRTQVGSPNSELQIYELIPESSTYFNYDGGLTTPPCSEVVEWNVADTPLSISVAQYNDLSGLILNFVSEETCKPATIASPVGATSRPIQDLNGRSVKRICPVGYKDAFAQGSVAGKTSGCRSWNMSAGAALLFVAAAASYWM